MSNLSLHSVYGYNYLLLAKNTLSDANIQTIHNLDYDPKWDSAPNDPFIILANFDEDLKSSKKSDIKETLTRWSIYRKKAGEDNAVLVGTIDNSEFTITDPMAANNQEYVYFIYPETENLIGQVMTTNSIKNSSGWGYTIANLLERSDGTYVSNEIWNLRLNVESGEVTQHLDATTLNTLGRYNKISRGDKNYLSMSVSCLLGNIDSNMHKFIGDIGTLNAWRDFISSSDKFIWKDRLGDIRIVAVTDDPTSQVLDETSEQATRISITVEEIMSKDDLKYGVIGDYSTSDDKSYTHVQSLNSERWIVTHALNKFPKVTIVDASGKVVYAQINHINKQITDIRLSKPITGAAFFN